MDNYTAGAIAGVAGGLTIAAVGMLAGAMRGTGFWSLPNGIGGIALGPDAGATRAFGVATLTGVAFHVVLSAVYGVVLVYLAHRVTGEYVLTGIALGIAVWLFNHYVVGAVHAGSRKLAQLNPVWLAAGLHALYGLVAGVVVMNLIA